MKITSVIHTFPLCQVFKAQETTLANLYKYVLGSHVRLRNICMILQRYYVYTALKIWTDMYSKDIYLNTQEKQGVSYSCAFLVLIIWLHYGRTTLILCILMHHQHCCQLCFSWIIFHWGWCNSQKIAKEMCVPSSTRKASIILLLKFCFKSVFLC